MQLKTWKTTCLCVALAVMGGAAHAEEEIELTGETLDAWRAPTGDWFVAGDARMNPDDEGLLSAVDGEGVIINGADGRTVNLHTELEHADVELHLEWMVPRGSNSGVYLQGRYEIQVLDSWGVEEPFHSDAGGLYQRWDESRPEGERGFDGVPPRVNASREPGAWQQFEITFRAPRFDDEGNKTENARFIRVVHNGIVIHENQEATGPTRAATFNDEKPEGPLMLQGDHGPVAYRNIRLRKIELD